jgi:hypothetical protein
MRPFLRAFSVIFMLRAKSSPTKRPEVRKKFLVLGNPLKSMDWLAGPEGIELLDVKSEPVSGR